MSFVVVMQVMAPLLLIPLYLLLSVFICLYPLIQSQYVN